MKFEKVDYGKKLRDYLNSDIDQMYKNMLLNLFPELGESEDESIKNWCISHFMECFRVSKDNAEYQEYLNNKVIPWLEKQGEKGTNGNEREIPNSAWSEEDEVGLGDAMWAIEQARTIAKDENDMGNLWCAERWLKSLKDRVQPQPKQELKQENTGDLTDFENAVMHIGSSFFSQYAGLDPNDTSAVKEQANLLLELVPKQEWSEEDEKMTKNLTSELYNLEARKLIDKETKDKYIKWLKSLRPQSKWKPSDEQMAALKYVVNLMASSERPTENDLYYNILKSLKEQLKRLREE